MENLLKQEKSNCIKVVLFGPESTGKTFLAKALAKNYNTIWVPEYSRVLAEERLVKGETLSKEDVLLIAKGQIALENKLSKQTDSLLICDTDLLETKVYCETYYKGYCPELLNKFAIENYYNLYFLTNIDIPWEADGIRDNPIERKAMFQAFENALISTNKRYVILQGTKEERLNLAISHIDKLFKEER